MDILLLLCVALHMLQKLMKPCMASIDHCFGCLLKELAAAAFNARVIPSVAFTDPEVAWVGLTETEAKAQGIKVKKKPVPVDSLWQRHCERISAQGLNLRCVICLGRLRDAALLRRPLAHNERVLAQ
jgi:hypothetical protein